MRATIMIIDQRYGGETREEPEDDQRPTDRLHNTYERAHHIWEWNANPGETPGPQDIGKDQFLQALGQKDHKSNQ